jgi:hypothetical protein
MSNQKFNIKKRGDYFVAFDTEDNKKSYGKVSIKTGKFVGDTRCMIALTNYWDENVRKKQDELYDKVLEQIKQDVADGDLSAIDELLKFVPKENLEAYLPEKL